MPTVLMTLFLSLALLSLTESHARCGDVRPMYQPPRSLNSSFKVISGPSSGGASQTFDAETSFASIKRQAEAGDPDALYFLGHAYYYGKNVDVDKAEAVKWYALAAKAGILEAQIVLGRIYLHGDGVDKDGASAVFWLKEAASRGLGAAHRDLGGIYEHGDIGSIDIEQAVFWYSVGEYYGDAQSAQNKAALLPLLSDKQVKSIAVKVKMYTESI